MPRIAISDHTDTDAEIWTARGSVGSDCAETSLRSNDVVTDRGVSLKSLPVNLESDGGSALTRQMF
jgi:hypothetical protein